MLVLFWQFETKNIKYNTKDYVNAYLQICIFLIFFFFLNTKIINDVNDIIFSILFTSIYMVIYIFCSIEFELKLNFKLNYIQYFHSKWNLIIKNLTHFFFIIVGNAQQHKAQILVLYKSINFIFSFFNFCNSCLAWHIKGKKEKKEKKKKKMWVILKVECLRDWAFRFLKCCLVCKRHIPLDNVPLWIH